MDLKEPLSFPDQVKRLQEHNLIIKDPKSAEKFLQNNNYYRFTGYALQYRIQPGNSDLKDGVSFEQVAAIYRFDEEMRNLLRKWIELLEVYFRTQIAYVFSMRKCLLPPHDQHYDTQKNYYLKADAKNVFDDFERQKKYYYDTLVYQHHQKKYNDKYPLWVIVEMLSFSDLSKLYGCMYSSDQEAIAQACGVRAVTLKNHLHCLSVLRNKCAHAARLYNISFRPSVQLPPSIRRKNAAIQGNTFFAYLLVLTRRLPSDEQKKEFIQEICDLVRKYTSLVDLSLIGFPIDYRAVLLSNRA